MCAVLQECTFEVKHLLVTGSVVVFNNGNLDFQEHQKFLVTRRVTGTLLTGVFLQKKERPYSLGAVPNLPIVQYYYRLFLDSFN